MISGANDFVSIMGAAPVTPMTPPAPPVLVQHQGLFETDGQRRYAKIGMGVAITGLLLVTLYKTIR